MRFVLLALGLLALDQWTKWLVINRMILGESIPVIDGIFHLTFVKNPGAAFGMLPYKTVFFIAMTVLVIAGIAYYFTQISEDRLLLKTGLAIQVGSAVGNLIDRIRFGYVIDFFDFRIWPVFNIADIGISIGVGILFIELLRSGKGSEEGQKG